MIPVSTRVMNLAHLLTQAARRFPDRPAIVWGDRIWSWADLDRRVDALATGLADLGITKGDAVLVQARNSNHIVETMFACFRLGAVWVPTNFRQTPDEVAHLARASEARVMLCDHVFPDHAAACAVPLTVMIGGGGDDIDALISRQLDAKVDTALVDRDDPCWFFFTSGTTGRPKAAVLTHGQMAFVITNHLADLLPGTRETDASLVVAPLSHGAGVHLLTQVARGAASILPRGERFDPTEAWALIEKWRVTNMFTVPTILKLLVEHLAVESHDHSSLRHVIYAGAPMYRVDQQRALRTLGPVLVQYFGLGEVTGAITVLPPGDHHAEDGSDVKVGTCGRERTGMQVSIQDADGVELPSGETGEICVCGPAVFAGYHDNPKANQKAFRDGWFRTGDLGYLDAQGDLLITGRESDMYISGGSNIYPREIEEKLLMHPAIVEAAVMGMPDPLWGEAGVAVCVRTPSSEAREQDVLEWLSDRIARYKLPKHVLFRDDLPKSGYGKVDKRALRLWITGASG